MKSDLLKKHIDKYINRRDSDPTKVETDSAERRERVEYYQSWTADKIRNMTEEDLTAYISKLWAMRIWGNKQYMVDKLISDNGFDPVKEQLVDLIWGSEELGQRWDSFRKNVKGLGPAMMSELLCHTHPDDCILWNRRAYVGLAYLGVENLPKRNYQVTGSKYVELSAMGREVADELRNNGIKDVNLLKLDYFIWDELQVEDNLTQMFKKPDDTDEPEKLDQEPPETAEFIHDEIKEKIRDIGQWLGFDSDTEKKVAEGSKIDTIWEATVGNMGRIVYVFEVQTKGSIDSLILNLLKSLNNPAVQGVVAVSDSHQLERIKKHAGDVAGFGEKLKYWDYTEVLKVHEALESVNDTINRLGLVPQGF